MIFFSEYVDNITIRSHIKAEHGTRHILTGNFWVLPAAKIRVIKAIRATLLLPLLRHRPDHSERQASLLPLKAKMKLNLILTRTVVNMLHLPNCKNPPASLG